MSENQGTPGTQVAVIDPAIFNTEKTDYDNTPLFLGQHPGLHDSINRTDPTIHNLYKKLKNMDWDELEFDFTPCKHEFLTGGTAAEMMIETIAFQWEADTIAARHLVPLVAPFVTNSDLWKLYSRIGDNENLHADTYSEIVKNSFDNPSEVITKILGINQALIRLEVVAQVFKNTHDVGLKLQTGGIARDSDEAYDAIFLFVVTLLCLERIQFMVSFAITFALANSGRFMPIGFAVQKICADEYEIHATAGKAILDIELRTSRGLMAFNRNREKINTILMEVLNSEIANAEFLFRDGRELPGVTKDTIIGHAWLCAKDVADFLGIELDSPYLEMPKLGYMDKWMNLDNMQGSPMELRDGKYLLGGVIPDDQGATFNIDGL